MIQHCVHDVACHRSNNTALAERDKAVTKADRYIHRGPFAIRAVNPLSPAPKDDANLGIPQPGAGKRLILDYSSPNVAKPMHVAHIRSTVIGDALKRIYRALGYEVLGDNHLGDWGTQFGILILGYRHFLDPAALDASPIDELQRIYVLAHQKCEAEPEWRDQARNERRSRRIRSSRQRRSRRPRGF